jgi:hypothetical protein
METKFNKFNVSNVSKTRKFPTWKDSNKNAGKSFDDVTYPYFIYDVKKQDLGKWLNTWFDGSDNRNKDNIIYRKELWTVKEVDKETASHLYNRKYNPVGLFIFCPTGGEKSKDFGKFFNFKAQIFSIDDSSYGMWFNHLPLDKIEELKIKLMKWLDSKSVVNGDEWFEFGKELGADDFDTN